MKKNLKKSQKRFSLKRLIPQTRKSRMITLVLLFALVGSIMVYRSFAATPPGVLPYGKGPFIYNYATNNLIAGHAGKCRSTPTTDSFIKPLTVWTIYCPSDTPWAAQSTNYARTWAKNVSFPSAYNGRRIKACALIKGSSGNEGVELGYQYKAVGQPNFSNIVFVTDDIKFRSSNFVSKCYNLLVPSGNSPTGYDLFVSIYAHRPNQFYSVGGITLEVI